MSVFIEKRAPNLKIDTYVTGGICTNSAVFGLDGGHVHRYNARLLVVPQFVK
jgi:hypothetical protein